MDLRNIPKLINVLNSMKTFKNKCLCISNDNVWVESISEILNRKLDRKYEEIELEFHYDGSTNYDDIQIIRN